MSERNTEEWIEAYLSQELTEGERVKFRGQLQDDPKLAEALAARREELLLYQTADRHLEKQELYEMYMNQQAKVVPFNNWAFYAIAASTVIFLLVWQFRPSGERQSYAELAAANYETYPLTVSRSGEGQELAQMAATAYQQGDYAGAIPLLEDWQEMKEGPDIPTFYLGHCYYQTKAYAMALTQWEQITDSSPLYEQSTWFRALAHLQLGQIDQARAILQGIVDTGYHYHLEEAEALLKAL
ncbi:MAG: tetratricopeptide repeat protein [Bacteroidota bacterium]